MANVRKIARRTFLVGSAALAGGVAFGYYAVQRPHDNPLLAGLDEGEAAFNPWVKISSDGITLITPHSDVGQGIASTQAALIAEELDVGFGQFEISFGKPDPAYYNHSFGPDFAPFLSTDQSLPASAVRTAFDVIIKMNGIQGTGGSTGAADSFEKLRIAGAVARETLKQAASNRTGVPISDLQTAKANVILPDGSTISYVDLALEAASIDPITEVELREPEQWRLVGKPMERLDILPKSTGAQTYGIDLEFEGMLHAAVKTNPRRGPMLSYDATIAETMRGVKHVLPVTNGVAVVADNTWRAFRAVDAIDFDWGPSPYPAEQEEHWTAVASSFTEERLNAEWRNDGDVDDSLTGAGQTLNAEYRAPYVAHQPMEPIGATIKVTEDRVDIWVGHQIPRTVQERVAAVTGHEVDAVQFHQQFVGGSFGHRLEWDNINLAAEIGNQLRGEIIKLTFSREEDFAQDYPRQIAMARCAGSVSDGGIETFDLEIAQTSTRASMAERSGNAIPGADSQIAMGAANHHYAIPNYRMRAYAVPGLAPVSSWRAVGASTGGFFAESFVDELIHASGRDPLEERLRLCNDPLSRQVLEAVGEMADWGSDIGPNRGRGIAFVESFGTRTAEIIDVTNTDQGIKIDRVFVALEVGRVVDPINFENNVQGGVVWGLGHAMNSEITYADGMAEQTNYHAHEGMRLYQCPEIIVRGLENSDRVTGIGEPPVAAAVPALANAIFAATGTRLREMPFNKFIDFV